MLKKYLSVLRSKNYDNNKKKVDRENRIGIELTLLFYTVILILNMIGVNFVRNAQLLTQLIYVVWALLFYHFYVRRKDRNYTFWLYMLEGPMLVIVMISGILQRPDELTFTFFVYLLLFPLLILDKPWRSAIFVISLGVLYAILASRLKDPAVFARDRIHLVNIVLMNIAANAFFQTVRLRNIEYADHFEELADTDPLTKLFNRAGAKHRIDPAKPGILIYLDLDQFKTVNDSFGHDAGDHVIVAVADLLRANFRRGDILVRLGGDEFAIFAPGKWTYDHVKNKLADLLVKVCAMHPENGETDYVHLTASIGCAYAPDGASSLEELLHVADKAMYAAKDGGKNDYRIVTI